MFIQCTDNFLSALLIEIRKNQKNEKTWTSSIITQSVSPAFSSCLQNKLVSPLTCWIISAHKVAWAPHSCAQCWLLVFHSKNSHQTLQTSDVCLPTAKPVMGRALRMGYCDSIAWKQMSQVFILSKWHKQYWQRQLGRWAGICSCARNSYQKCSQRVMWKF